MPNKVPVTLRDYCTRCMKRSNRIIEENKNDPQAVAYELGQYDAYKEILHLIDIIKIDKATTGGPINE